MARATKVITLPAPEVKVAPVTHWIIAEIRFSPLVERASVLLVAGDEFGNQIDGGASENLQADPATYQQFFSSQFATALVNLAHTVGVAKGVLSAQSTVEDAQTPV